MAFGITLYKFAKSRVSTKQVDVDGFSTVGSLKESTGILAPSITFHIGTVFPDYNYAYINEFDRFYFINDWIHEKGLWTAQMSVDVLASWKPEIGASRQYILRTSYAFRDNVIDTLYPVMSLGSHAVALLDGEQESLFEDILLTDGTFVLGVIGASENSVGAVTYYTLTLENFGKLCSALMGNIDWTGVPTEEISQQLLKAMFNPFQYVVSCVYYPFSMEKMAGQAVTEIKIGWWTFTTDAELLSTLVPYNLVWHTITLPKHPDSGTRGTYLNSAPFTEYTLDIKPFGNIVVDPKNFANSEKMHLEVKVDLISGTGRLRISNADLRESSSPTLAESVCMVGVPIQMAQVSGNPFGFVSSLIDTAGRLAVGDYLGAANGIGNGINSAIPSVATQGGNGGFGDFIATVKLNARFLFQVDESNTRNGRPLCQERTINTLGGYILVQNADLSIPCTAGEMEQITGFMESGFYYE